MDLNGFFISADIKSAKFNLYVHEEHEDCTVLKFTMSAEEKIIPQPVKIEWKVPARNVVSVWAPLLGFSRFIAPNWNKTRCKSKTAIGAPILSLINYDGTNFCTIATSDPKTPTFL